MRSGEFNVAEIESESRVREVRGLLLVSKRDMLVPSEKPLCLLTLCFCMWNNMASRVALRCIDEY